MMNDVLDLDDHEVDSSVVFRQPASHLADVKNLESTLEKFGFRKDDRIDRRDMVMMYKTVEKEMEKEISSYALESDYNQAKLLRSRLNSIREEFCGLQTGGVKTQKIDQSINFEQASKGFKADISYRHKEELRDLIDYCERCREDLLRTHEIQTENLEKKCQRIIRPSPKYSKTLVDLMHAEKGYVEGPILSKLPLRKQIIEG